MLRREVTSSFSLLYHFSKNPFPQSGYAYLSYLPGWLSGVSDSGPGGCEFDPRLRRTFFPAYFRISPLQKHERKVVSGFGKKSCVSTSVRKPGNTCASPTAMI